MIPSYKDYIWGGEKLKNLYGKKTNITPLSESWELSCHDNGLSVISNGKYAGMSLKEYLILNKNALGTLNKSGEFPILIKLIDANDDLSIQVHPNDEQAAIWEKQNGKTEMWYVIDADKDARIVFGVNGTFSKEEFKDAIRKNNLMPMLNSIPSKKGDTFFVKAGTVHAICKGNLIAEIQQNSDVTYRLYDYERKDKYGKYRHLDIEKGVNAAVLEPTKTDEPVCDCDGNRILANCEYFCAKEINLNDKMNLHVGIESYVALLNLGDDCVKVADVEMNRGECVFLPAGIGELELLGKAKILLVSESF